MIYTSYFAMIRNFPENYTPVSISRFPPSWYDGKGVKNLAPSEELLKGYKEGKVTEEEYDKQYKSYLNGKVTPDWFKKGMSAYFPSTKDGKPIWESETDHAVLCCFEKEGEFCHRHILAEHLTGFGIPVREISKEELKKDRPQKKDLFGIEEGILVQQVNCQGVMNAGLAKAIADKFPIVKEKYLESFKGREKSALFGKISVIPLDNEGKLSVANVYSQEYYGNPKFTGKVYTCEDILVNSIKRLSEKYPDKMVYIPEKIGCGFGGGNWESIKGKIDLLGKNNIRIVDTIAGLKKEPVFPKLDYIQEVTDLFDEIETLIKDRISEDDEWGTVLHPSINSAHSFDVTRASLFDQIKAIINDEADPDPTLPKRIVDHLMEIALYHEYNDICARIDEFSEKAESIAERYKFLFPDEELEK